MSAIKEGTGVMTKWTKPFIPYPYIFIYPQDYINSDDKMAKVKRICKQCSKEFEVYPYQVKDGDYRKFLRGLMKTSEGSTKPTKPERIFEGLCNRNNLPFKYTGDRSLWLGNANPDFIHNTRKLVCEVFGDFWHSPLLRWNLRYNETLEGRRKQLKAEGYKLIVFWETDLKRKDAEQFVLHTLKKEGVKW